MEVKSDSAVILSNNRGNNHQMAFRRKSASLSSSMSNLIRHTKKGGHFKELKNKIAAHKLFSSLDRLDRDHMIKEEDEKPKKVVKNLNEFLNFSGINKNKISDQSQQLQPNNEKPKILLTKSSFDDSESSVSEKPRHSSTTTTITTDDTDTFDDYSPDDSQEYFPLTTSVTRELRLELENLDRKVFGDKYVDRLSESPSSEGEEVESKTETRNAEVRPVLDKPADVFIWENPLHQGSPKHPDYTATPDEQLDIDYDAPSMVNETSASKTITPIRIINSTDHQKLNSTMQKVVINLAMENGSNSCEEVQEVKAATFLPPPNEFGGGNPFLMFLCLTVLLQHRDHIISKGMDYNEMAMHFDKMVRKHDVTRVLNQARQMYARYMKEQTIAHHHLENLRNERC